jgi:hypothetical protein
VTLEVRLIGEAPSDLGIVWNPAQTYGGRVLQDGGVPGTYREERVTDAPGTLWATTQDGRYVLREGIRPSEGPFELRLEPGLPTAGRVEGSGLGEEAMLVRFWRDRIVMGAGPVAVDGSFSVPGLPPGTYELHVVTAVDHRCLARTSSVSAGSTDVRVRLP